MALTFMGDSIGWPKHLVCTNLMRIKGGVNSAKLNSFPGKSL